MFKVETLKNKQGKRNCQCPQKGFFLIIKSFNACLLLFEVLNYQVLSDHYSHLPAYSEKSINHHPLELPSSVNLTQSSGPGLTEEDATSLIAEGFLLNASDYKQLSMGRSPAHWIVGNWSEVRVPFLTSIWKLTRGVAFLCRFRDGFV